MFTSRAPPPPPPLVVPPAIQWLFTDLVEACIDTRAPLNPPTLDYIIIYYAIVVAIVIVGVALLFISICLMYIMHHKKTTHQ